MHSEIVFFLNAELMKNFSCQFWFKFGQTMMSVRGVSQQVNILGGEKEQQSSCFPKIWPAMPTICDKFETCFNLKGNAQNL